MRQVHEVKVPLLLQQQIRRETFTPKWREIVRSFYERLEQKPSGDRPAVQLHQFMHQKLSLIQQLVHRADTLAQVVQRKSNVFVLCHSDIHAGNVLLSGAETIYIVDWDEPIMAPKERDLMFIGGGVANVWNEARETALFYRGYGETKIDDELLTYYRNERIVEDIAVYAQALLTREDGGANREQMYQHFVAMFEPRGVVEIGLS